MRVNRSTAILLALACTAPLARGDDAPQVTAAALDAFARLPIQEAGRVKPISTLARFRLLRLRGALSCPTADGRRLSETEWLLRLLLWPELARKDPLFLVQNDEVLDAIGLPHEGRKKRDRYSWDELFPARAQLFQKATEFQAIPKAERSVAQDQVVDLAGNVFDFQLLAGFLDFAREDLPLEQGARSLSFVFRERQAVRFSEVLGRSRELLTVYQALRQENMEQQLDPATRQREIEAMDRFVRRMDELAGRAQGLAFCPAPEGVETWRNPAQVTQAAFEHGAEAVAADLLVLRCLEDVARARGDPAALEASLVALRERLATQIGAQYDKVPLEVSFYRGAYFERAPWIYVLAFVLVAISWLVPPGGLAGRWLGRAALATCSVALLLHTVGIAYRCVLRGRPPVTTLYETILFISACAVLVALVIEWLHRQRVGLSLAPVLGATGLFLANSYEALEAHTAADTMPALEAVLDTNFWLSTHVTTVTLGYSAGLLAGAIAHLWVLGRVFAPLLRRAWGAPTRLDQPAFYRDIARLTYGVICFGLFFSVLGTILGGIWANYSWGRFWGWDPKENGALLIVLWELAILHGRMGGYLREAGLCLAAIAGNVVVGFSWWGVNLLNVGLHSYGFTSQVKYWVTLFYGVELAVVALGLGWWALHRSPRAAEPSVEPAPGG